MFRMLRIAIRLIKCLISPSLDVREGWVTQARVWFSECDLNIVNNSVYFFYFELARWEMIYQTQGRKFLKENRAIPLVTSQVIRIVRPLKRFQRFVVISKIAHWDERTLYIDHRIESEGKLYAYGFVKGVIRGPEESLTMQKVLPSLGLTYRELPENPRFSHFNQSENLQFQEIRNHH